MVSFKSVAPEILTACIKHQNLMILQFRILIKHIKEYALFVSCKRNPLFAHLQNADCRLKHFNHLHIRIPQGNGDVGNLFRRFHYRQHTKTSLDKKCQQIFGMIFFPVNTYRTAFFGRFQKACHQLTITVIGAFHSIFTHKPLSGTSFSADGQRNIILLLFLGSTERLGIIAVNAAETHLNIVVVQIVADYITVFIHFFKHIFDFCQHNLTP